MSLRSTTVLIALESLLQVDIFYFRHVPDLDHRHLRALALKSQTHRRKVPHIENQWQTCEKVRRISEIFTKPIWIFWCECDAVSSRGDGSPTSEKVTHTSPSLRRSGFKSLKANIMFIMF